MPLGVPTTIQFDFDNVTSGIQSVSGFITIPFGTQPLVFVNGTATYTAAGGITFTHTVVSGSTSYDSTNDNRMGPGGTNTLSVGSGLNFTNVTFEVVGVNASATNTIEFLNGTGVVVGSLTDAQIVAGNISYTGMFDAIRFTSSNAISIASMRTTLNCFTAGTSIATPTGPRAVETLAAGDMVLTSDGREAPVKWLGLQNVDTRLTHPDKVNPICITAGALGGGLPKRDLILSRDHAVAIDGLLINAGALVNGTTIYQKPKMPKDGFTYYHVETDAHELLLAEGVAAESFIDYAGRDSFDNATDSTRVIAEMDQPRISSARLLPEHTRRRLAPDQAA